LAQAWEFKHPEFRADAKNKLDSIRRKAPAPRKAQAAEEQYSSNTQVVALTETLAATQQQVQALQDSYFEMAHANKVFIDEILHLQKLVKAQTSISNELINHLNKSVQDRRHGGSNHSTPAQYGGNLLSDGTEDLPNELKRARDLLNSISGEHIPERDLRQMSIALQQVGASPESAGSSGMMAPPSHTGMNNNNFIHDPMNDMRHMVYPVGQTIGIDPFAAEHMGNIPYNRPLSQNAMTSGPEPNAVPSTITPPGGSSGQGGSPWGIKKPRILLVEDDKTCSRIGSKFLSQYDCGVEVAVSTIYLPLGQAGMFVY
jgi:osomolarity two-component system, response regulator SKN7